MGVPDNSDLNFEHFDELASDYGDGEYFESYEEDPESGFSIKQPLPAPSASLHTMKELHAMIHKGEIDLSPEYQRSVVWKNDKQMMLIESIFRNFYVPPILFHIAETEDGIVRICVDGKQRLTSITRFMEGQIPYRDPKTKKRHYYTVPASQKGKVLQVPLKAKKLFEDKTLTCVEYRDLNPSIERDVFQRVQLGMSLTAAEKLQAISSPYSSWINGLDAKHVSGEEGGLARLITWDTDRGRNFLGLASMAFCWENLPSRSDPSSAKLTHWLSRLDEPSQKLKEDIEAILYRFYMIASTEAHRFPFKKMKAKVAPVEFVFIGILIGILSHLGNEMLAQEIQEFRRYVRQKHTDIRANHRVMATMWEFIEDAHERSGNTRELGAKRKRREDDDEEYVSGPVTNLGPTPKTRSRLM